METETPSGRIRLLLKFRHLVATRVIAGIRVFYAAAQSRPLESFEKRTNQLSNISLRSLILDLDLDSYLLSQESAYFHVQLLLELSTHPDRPFVYC